MDVQQVFQAIKELPVIPRLMQELMTSFNDPNSEVEGIADKIAMDPVITAKVLRMASSAAFTRGKEITSIQQAVIRPGFARLRSLVVAASLSECFQIRREFNVHKYWTDTFQVATIAQCLAEQSRGVQIEPDTAFTCGLLHDIGELLIQSALTEEAGLIEMIMDQGSSRVEAQRKVLGMDYSQLGAELARQWNLSPVFIEAIHNQLDPLAFGEISAESVLIRVSVFVSFAWNASVPAELIAMRFPKPLAEYLGTDPKTLTPHLEVLHQQGNALADLLTS
ncbi:HDOD domain-containing protein [Dongshaea marina]|uniref:HDOD domain-containing protein n=1 Tax=Dongshaea marina TaxID=2047966 RepID=UPI000D3E1B4E|nr:HDOD domain-containing protein [Dongshaea marina]